MGQVINTNINSIIAQNNLNKTSSGLMRSVERLSSGLRINSARDDAAGLAKATRMSTQIGGLEVAMRNASDGISIAQTAEGAMSEMVKALNRINDLALQAASYNSSTDRASLDSEVQQLVAELERITSQTKFNGEKILNSNFSATLQVGANVNETVSLSIDALSTASLGVASNYNAVSQLTTVSTTIDADTLARRIGIQYTGALSSSTIQGSTGSAYSLDDVSANTNTVNKIDAINEGSATSGVSAFSYGNGFRGDVVDSNAVAFTNADTNNNETLTLSAGYLRINGVDLDQTTVTVSATSNLDFETAAAAIVTAINNKTGEHGVQAMFVEDLNGDNTNDEASDSAIVLVNTTGNAIDVQINDSLESTEANTTYLGTGSGATLVASLFTSGTVSAGANGAIILNDSVNQATVTFGNAATMRSLSGVEGAGTTAALTNNTLASSSVTTTGNANLTIIAVEKALSTINSSRSTLGAVQNRLETLTSNLESVVQNTKSARSRIMDTDFAKETAELSKAQILAQAGTAMVAQANTLQQNVLALLQG